MLIVSNRPAHIYNSLACHCIGVHVHNYGYIVGHMKITMLFVTFQIIRIDSAKLCTYDEHHVKCVEIISANSEYHLMTE